jgi:predicted naringenin-chalcone synthase
LSLQLPKVISAIVPEVVKELLKRNRLVLSDIDYWAIHPGGDKIVDELETALSLSKDKMAITRGILHDYGNMSSATVMFELKKILDLNPVSGEWVMAIAFGAGLSVFAYLMKRS